MGRNTPAGAPRADTQVGPYEMPQRKWPPPGVFHVGRCVV